MNSIIVVTEGLTDVEFLRKVLPKEDLAGLRFFAAGNRISLASVARNVLVHEGGPVLAVMDADRINPAAAEEARLYTKAAIAHVAGQVPFDVFCFLPMIEVVYFEAPNFWMDILNRKLGESELAFGLVSPKDAAQKLFQSAESKPGLDTLVSCIDEKGAALLRQGKQLASLIRVIRNLGTSESETAALTNQAD